MRGLQSPQGGSRLFSLTVMILFWCFTILFLLFLSAEDLKRRRVRLLPALVFGTGTLLTHLILADLPPEDLFRGILLGISLFAVSLITHSAIGAGDALAVLSCASALGGSAELAALLLSLLFTALFSSYLLLRRKITRKDTIPFLPFLLAGHLVLTLPQIISR